MKLFQVEPELKSSLINLIILFECVSGCDFMRHDMVFASDLALLQCLHLSILVQFSPTHCTNFTNVLSLHHSCNVLGAIC